MNQLVDKFGDRPLAKKENNIMENNYLIEVIQKQTLFVEVKALSSLQAEQKALTLDGEINRPYSPEVEQIKARIIRAG